MRRIELLNAIDEVLTAIRESNIYTMTMRLLRKTDSSGDQITDILKCIQKYSILASKFSPTAREVLKIMELEPLEDMDFWTKALFTKERDGLTYRMSQLTNFALNNLPLITDLLKQEHSDNQNLSTDQEVISIIVLEENNQVSTIERVLKALEGVKDLYEACSIFLDDRSIPLSVIACDSGSDKSFDLLGAAKVIECIKEIILGVWDKVVYYRELQMSQRIGLISEALPVIERISEMERKKQIEPEQAEILRRKITGGVEKLITSGVIIPEVEKRSVYNPRILMAPEPKLLSSVNKRGDDAQEPFVKDENGKSKSKPVSHSSDEEGVEELDSTSEFSIDRLSEEDKVTFMKLLKKANGMNEN